MEKENQLEIGKEYTFSYNPHDSKILNTLKNFVEEYQKSNHDFFNNVYSLFKFENDLTLEMLGNTKDNTLTGKLVHLPKEGTYFSDNLKIENGFRNANILEVLSFLKSFPNYKGLPIMSSTETPICGDQEDFAGAEKYTNIIKGVSRNSNNLLIKDDYSSFRKYMKKLED